MATEPISGALMYPEFESRAPIVSHAKGIWIYDVNGKDYIDGSSGAMTVSIGHGQEGVARAAYEQIRSIAFSYRSQFRNEPAETLAQNIVSLAQDKAFAFFMNSGSEANEAAYRIALQYWKAKGKSAKRKVIGRAPSNHGNTIGTLSIAHDVRRDEIADVVIPGSDAKLAPCYCYRCPFGKSPSSCQTECARDLERIVLEIGPESIAAFFAEPITGALGGALTPPANYFSIVRDICNRYEILLVADEVVSGFGRTGSWFAMHQWSVTADISVIGKGLAGGYTPLSGCLVTKDVGETLAECGRIPIGHTHSANPLSASIANAVLAYMQEQRLVDLVAGKAARLEQGLRGLSLRHPLIGDVRGRGLLWALEFVGERTTKAPLARAGNYTANVVRAARDAGLVVYPCRGLDPLRRFGGGDAILLAPPLVITNEEIDILLQRLDVALANAKVAIQ